MQHSGSRISVFGLHGELARTCFVERSLAVERAFARDGHVSIGAHHHSLFLYRAYKRHYRVGNWGDEPVVVVAHKVVAVHHVHLFGLSLGVQFGIFRIHLALVCAQTEAVGSSGCQSADGICLCVGIYARHFLVFVAIFLLQNESVLTLGIVRPAQSNGLVGRAGGGEEERSAQEYGAILCGQAVYIVLNVGVAIGRNSHGIVLCGVGAVGFLPLVGHSVAVRIHGFVKRLHLP